MAKTMKAGALAGIAGGVVFGMLMAMMGMLKVIAGMVGSSSPAIGFVVHILISAFIGAGFGLIFSGFAASRLKSTVAGLAYGMVWWILGPLTLMPAMMGMGFGSHWNSAAAAAAMPSLMGHLVYGAILGFTFARLMGRVKLESLAWNSGAKVR